LHEFDLLPRLICKKYIYREPFDDPAVLITKKARGFICSRKEKGNSPIVVPSLHPNFPCPKFFLPTFKPVGSMYGIFAYVYHKNQPNVGKYW